MAGHPPLTGALAAVLAEGRDRWNARLAALHRARRGADDALALDLLRGPVAGVVASIADGEQARRVAVAATDLALSACEHRLFAPGPHLAGLHRLWSDLLPALAPLIAAAPRPLIAGLTNAAVALGRDDPALAGRWLDRLLVLGPRCADADTCLRLGRVLAWTSGRADLREAALAACRVLPGDLLRDVLGLAPGLDPAAAVPALKDPWWNPARPSGAPLPTLVGRVGGFAGFGPGFTTPPQVACEDGVLIAWDAIACHRLCADRWGARLLPHGPGRDGQGERTRQGLRLDADGTVQGAQASMPLPLLASSCGRAWDGRTLAVVLPHSYHVFLVAEVVP